MPALLLHPKDDKGIVDKLVDIGQKLCFSGWIVCMQLFQNQFLQSKLHIQKKYRIIGIQAISSDKGIYLSVEPVFITVEKEA